MSRTHATHARMCITDRTVDEDIQVSKAFLRVIAQLTPKNDEKMVLEACDTLVSAQPWHVRDMTRDVTRCGAVQCDVMTLI